MSGRWGRRRASGPVSPGLCPSARHVLGALGGWRGAEEAVATSAGAITWQGFLQPRHGLGAPHEEGPGPCSTANLPGHRMQQCVKASARPCGARYPPWTPGSVPSVSLNAAWPPALVASASDADSPASGACSARCTETPSQNLVTNTDMTSRQSAPRTPPCFKGRDSKGG